MNYNEKLQQLQEKVSQKRSLESKLKELQSQRGDLDSRVRELEKIMWDEQADVTIHEDMQVNIDGFLQVLQWFYTESKKVHLILI